MDDMASVYEALRNATDTFDDDEEAARAVLDAARTRKDVVALVLPLVVAEANHQRRHRSRAVERRVERGGQDRDPVDVAKDRGEWLKQQIALGDGRVISWADATVDDHEARIAYLTRLRDGIDRTIQRHRAAVAMIQAAESAKCLGDLDLDDLDGLTP